MKNYFLFLVFSFLLGNVSLFAERSDIYIPREDGTIIQGYFDRPDGEKDVPVVIFINGSFEQSVLPFQEKLAARFNPQKVAVISLEKRGITPNGIDQKEFYAHDCFKERLLDHFLLLKQIEEEKIEGCNGRIILLGASEGGKIAPRLSLDFPTLIQGIVLIGSGGGLSFAEEMKFQSQQLIQQMSSLNRLRYKMKSSLYPKEVDRYYHKMLSEPESLKMCGPKTWKWFASYLQYDLLSDLLDVKTSIYMIHGQKDILVPVRSADLIQEAFKQAGKMNLQYMRYEDLGHELVGREDVLVPMAEWMCFKLFLSQNLEKDDD